MRRRRVIIPGCKSKPELGPRAPEGIRTSHLDLARVIDFDAVRRNNAAMRASRRADAQRAAAQREMEEAQEYALLVAAWESAPKGEAKRDALTALRAHEDRHGRMPHGREIAYAHAVDVSTGAESWLEVK